MPEHTERTIQRLRTARRRLASALIANAERLDKPFTDDPSKNPWDNFIRPAMRELKAAVDEVTVGPAAGQDYTVQVWPLARILAEVQCGSQDWTWEEEWADLDHYRAKELADLEKQIKANGITEPVLIGSDGRLWNGHHRLRLAVRLGIGYVPVMVPSGVTQPAIPASEQPS